MLFDVLMQVSHKFLTVGVSSVLDFLRVFVGLMKHEGWVVLEMTTDVVELVVLSFVLDERLECVQVLEHLHGVTLFGGDGGDLWLLIFLGHCRVVVFDGMLIVVAFDGRHNRWSYKQSNDNLEARIHTLYTWELILSP